VGDGTKAVGLGIRERRRGEKIVERRKSRWCRGRRERREKSSGNSRRRNGPEEGCSKETKVESKKAKCEEERKGV